MLLHVRQRSLVLFYIDSETQSFIIIDKNSSTPSVNLNVLNTFTKSLKIVITLFLCCSQRLANTNTAAMLLDWIYPTYYNQRTATGQDKS